MPGLVLRRAKNLKGKKYVYLQRQQRAAEATQIGSKVPKRKNLSKGELRISSCLVLRVFADFVVDCLHLDQKLLLRTEKKRSQKSFYWSHETEIT